MENSKLRDKTIVITGGTGDIGRAITLNLTSMGADVAILDKNPEKATRLVEEISQSREVKEDNGKAAYFEVNLTDLKATKEAISRAAETFGGIDVFISALQTSRMSLINEPNYIEEFDRLIDINLKSAVYTTQSVLPFMKGRKRGKIIYLISDLVRWGSEGESITSITRGGIVFYTKSLARELAMHNISVNCIAVGPTEDYLLSRDPKASSIKSIEEKLMQSMPMGRTLYASEVAQSVVFLASSASDAVTGQTWAVNGGLTMF